MLAQANAEGIFEDRTLEIIGRKLSEDEFFTSFFGSTFGLGNETQDF